MRKNNFMNKIIKLKGSILAGIIQIFACLIVYKFKVANFLEIKRQRIQEYEKAGIAIKPKVKDKHGYWLYGEAEIERLWQIKFYLTRGCGRFLGPELSETMRKSL